MSNNISDSFIATYGLPKSRELSGVEPETEAAADASLSVALQKTKPVQTEGRRWSRIKP